VGWVPTNVARSARPPCVRAAKVERPTPEEVRRLIAEAEDRNPSFAALIMLAALTGARRGDTAQGPRPKLLDGRRSSTKAN
jgi:integrase